jgi:hypothetical protein
VVSSSSTDSSISQVSATPPIRAATVDGSNVLGRFFDLHILLRAMPAPTDSVLFPRPSGKDELWHGEGPNRTFIAT